MPRFSLEMLAPYVRRLRDLPFVSAARAIDATTLAAGTPLAREAAGAIEFELVDGSMTTRFVAHRASHLSTDVAQHLNAKLGAEASSWIVLAPHVGAPLGAAFDAAGLDFIDRQGNCSIRVDLRYLARIQGRNAPKASPRLKELRAPGYQVMFALLSSPELLAAPQREIAVAAGTSRQPVIDLLARFVEEGRLERERGKHVWRRPRDAALLDRFVAGYRATLRPKLVLGHFRVPVQAPEEIEDWVEEQIGIVRYGGMSAAHRLEAGERGHFTVAHLGRPSAETRDHLAADAHPDGELVWLRDIGTVSELGATPDTVHPVLVYAELMSSSDPRAGDAAREVRERWLDWAL